MDNLENVPSAPTGELGELRAQFEALRGLVTSILILLVVVTGTFALYLGREVKFKHDELKAFRPQASQVIGDFNKNFAPGMNDFIRKLEDFARTHPDFAPILAKYGLKPSQAPVVAPSTAPTSAPPPATKK